MVAELVDLIERHTTTSKLALVGDARKNTSRAHAFHGQYAVPIWVDSSYLSAQRIRLLKASDMPCIHCSKRNAICVPLHPHTKLCLLAKEIAVRSQ